MLDIPQFEYYLRIFLHKRLTFLINAVISCIFISIDFCLWTPKCYQLLNPDLPMNIGRNTLLWTFHLSESFAVTREVQDRQQLQSCISCLSYTPWYWHRSQQPKAKSQLPWKRCSFMETCICVHVRVVSHKNQSQESFLQWVNLVVKHV